VVQYRCFRNTDPPALAEVWNEAFVGRGAVRLRHSSPLEHHVFAKPYFDPAGLILAEDNGTTVGFVHAGFGANETETALSPTTGVICILGVRPSHRRQGIGSELLRRAEDYLRARGATTLYAGPTRRLDPFYLGLYGGSEMPGFLASDPMAQPFFERHTYQVQQTTLVFQRRLERPLSVADARFAVHRVHYDLRITPRKTVGTWWQEATLGLLEPFDFRLEDKQSGQVVAQTSVWEMVDFSWRWSQPSVGLTELVVRPEMRRRGLAKFLLAQILRYLQDQFFGIVEIQAPDRDEPALKLLRSLGFEQVDTGRSFRRSETAPPA
jgi:ribosomal protein S18 acetylase RimI-like enzyme